MSFAQFFGSTTVVGQGLPLLGLAFSELLIILSRIAIQDVTGGTVQMRLEPMTAMLLSRTSSTYVYVDY